MNHYFSRAVSAHCIRYLARTLLVCGALLASVTAASASQQLYTCGMHPQVIKTEPGDCPICHMKLTPLLGSGGAAAGGGMSGGAAAQLATISIDPGTIQRMNLKTEQVQRQAAEREVRTVGVVAFDERTQLDITTRYEGWIEKMYVNASWQRVKAGEPLFEIYSPALYNAQLNYLVALRSEGEQGGALSSAALERLRLLGVSDAFIEQLQQSGKAERNYIYRAPADGVVVEKFARQGQMITAGQPIYSFASLSPVWVLAQVYEKDLPLVKAGQTARVRGSYGQTPVVFEGAVAEILPQVQDATRAAIARIVLDNTDESLLPGMFADVRFVADLGDSAVLVADEAVLRSGEKNTVFVALGEGRFEPREVVLGPRTNDHRYVVKEGLSEGETVVVSGQFMLDSESRLREAIAKMVSAATGESGGMLDAESALHLALGHNHGATGGSGTGGSVAASADKKSAAASGKATGSAHADHAAHNHADSHAAHNHADHAAHGGAAVGSGVNAHGATAMAEDHSCCAPEGVTGAAVNAQSQTAATAHNHGTAAAGDHACCVAEGEGASGAHAAHAGHAHAGSGSAHAGHGDHSAHAAAASAPAAVDACCGGAANGAPASAEQIAAATQKREQMRRAPLVVLAFAAADASMALAKDDFPAYRAQLPALQKALEAYVAEAKLTGNDPLAAALGSASFTAPRNIAQARDAFAPLNNRLAQVIMQSGLNKSGVIHVFECPMVPKVGTGRWLQRENKDAWNPYFGASMLHCGGIVE